MARRVIYMNKVCPSFCLEVFFELVLQSFLEPNMVLGAHAVLCLTKPDVLKTMFCCKIRKISPAQGSLNAYIGKFSFFSQFFHFFSVWSIMKVLYYCNFYMLEQIPYLEKFWFLKYDPKCSWPIRLQDFSINGRTLKLTLSHIEINGINRFLVCPSNSFLKNISLGFYDFWQNGR